MSIEPDWEKRLKGKPFRKPMFTAGMWDRLEASVSSNSKKPAKPILRRSAVMLAVLAALAVGYLAAMKVEPGLLRAASEKLAGVFESRTPPVTDPATPDELPAVSSLGSQRIVHTIVNDAMARSAHLGLGDPVVVDLDYYRTRSESSDRPVARGDIVYYETAAENPEAAREPHDIARVIGLPGETIRIAKGRIYIDGRPLEANYGKENGGRKDAKRSSARDQEIELGSEQYYLLGDVWSRSFNDSQSHGAFAMASIRGKAIGYYDPPDIQHTDWTELYREGGLTIQAARSESGVYQRYLADWGGERKEFYWTGSTDPSYPPTVTMTDLDDDGEDEAVVALIIGTGTESVQSEVHVLRRGLTEIPVADPAVSARAATQAAEINRSKDKVEVKLAIGGKTIERTYDADDASLWFDKPGIGAVVYYRIEHGRLVSDLSVFATPATYVATIKAEYRMKDGALIPARFSAADLR
ncbi:signal peptidase I [Paenibacillus sp. MWE-103]|uniref:Signal peptidase I n=1 Tax=Paenibacillus artemisiicola TaxID=1172618 RepID=A0ABS3W5J9_9BACL|nr:signal peptidase I [Paenibacillus artemisiicola]MBO7743564.1 signal peptidase I [Paenibacillus artemisiicola]